MTGHDGLDRLLHQREAAMGIQQSDQIVDRPTKLGRRTTAGSQMARLPAGPPCAVVSGQRGVVMKQLANSERHDAVLGPVLQLVRLAEQGHRGVASALLDVHEDFVGRVRDDRAGGRPEAQQEWRRALNGALAQVFGRGMPAVPHACCSCVITDLRAALNDDRLFTPRGKLSERKVMRYMLMRAQYRGSLLVHESQRQIAEAVDINQPTVARVLGRLVSLGWLTRTTRRSRLQVDGYVLNRPGVVKELSPRIPAGAAGPLGDTRVNAFVHRLFGPKGLGPGPAETFAALPEWRRPCGDGVLVRKTPTVPVTPGMVNPWRGTRQIPRPARGEGVTPADLARRTGKSTPTVRRHLKRLSQMGMVFTQRGRWWRYRFDPAILAASLGIVDTAGIKAKRHDQQRRAYYESLSQGNAGRPPLVKRVKVDDGVAFVSEITGQIVWKTDRLF